MATYRTKPVQIEAHRFDGNEWTLMYWVESHARQPGRFRFDNGAVFIETPEGEMRGDVGDYIICGLRGEFYPCKPDVFHAKYELAATPAPTGAPPALPIIDGREPCPKCGAKADLIADAAHAEAPRDVWECPTCRHQWAS